MLRAYDTQAAILDACNADFTFSVPSTVKNGLNQRGHGGITLCNAPGVRIQLRQPQCPQPIRLRASMSAFMRTGAQVLYDYVLHRQARIGVINRALLHVTSVSDRCQPRRHMGASPKKKARRAAEKLGLAPSTFAYRKLTVALVGRPNVGKSSLFNRLAQEKAAIVHSTPGTTRDWKEATGVLGELEFTVMDTGGLEDRSSRNAIENKMLQHTEIAIRHADVVLFVVDGRLGITEEDQRFARWVKQRRPQGGVHLLANKMEGYGGAALSEIRWAETIDGCYTLGMGDPIPVSGEHGEGLPEIHDVLEPYARISRADRVTEGTIAAAAAPVPVGLTLEPTPAVDADVRLPSDPRKRKLVLQRLARQEGPVQIAIVGRPNVGKSTVVNQLIGEERVLSGPTPGLTRDTTTVDLTVAGRTVRLVDTAGMRRFGAWDLSTPLEGESVAMAKRALERSHVVVLVVDGSGGTAEGLTHHKIRFVSRQQLERGGKYGKVLGSPDPDDIKRNAIARVAERVGGSAEERERDAETARALGQLGVPTDTGGARVSRVGMGSAYGLTRQDASIVEQILEQGRALVIVLNKLDASAAPDEVARVVRGQLDSMHQGKGIELVPISALKGRGVEELLPSVLRTYDRWNVRVGTSRLNKWMSLTLRAHPAPTVQRTVGTKGRGSEKKSISVPVQLKIKYVAQVATRPPTFTVWANRSDVPDAYKRFFVNSLRTEFDLGGTPIRLNVRAAENPFTKMGRKARAGVLLARARKLQGTQGSHSDAVPATVESRTSLAGDQGQPQVPRGRRVEKADGKRDAYRESRASSETSVRGGNRRSGTRTAKSAGPRPFAPSVQGVARSTSMDGGRVARVQARYLKKMREAKAKAKGV